jgi:glycerol-3-phosphate dehydrogenase
MAEDAVDHAAAIAGLELHASPTRELQVHGYHLQSERHGALAAYGSDALEIEDLARSHPGWGDPLHPELELTPAEVVWGVREEMAVRLEDVLSRRSRSLVLNARASLEVAESVAGLMARELGRDEEWVEAEVRSFTGLARTYQV